MEVKSNKEVYQNFVDSLPVSVILYNDEKIFLINSQAIKTLKGSDKNDFIGKSFWDFVSPDNFNGPEKIIRKITEDNENSKLTEERFICIDGNIIDVEIAGSFVDYDGITLVQVVFNDISERKKIERALVESEEKYREIQKNIEINLIDSLREKETLLKEINHRVKNNLQIIISLLHLQLPSIKNEVDKEIYNSSISRIYAMALVHKKLYQSGNISEINFNPYIRELVSTLICTYFDYVNRVETEFEINDVFIGMDKGVTTALLINEIISNSLKYAFPDETTGKIFINFNKDDNNYYSLTIYDNGIGFLWPDNDFKNINTLGFKLIDSLVKQLDGELTVISGENWGYFITFSE